MYACDVCICLHIKNTKQHTAYSAKMVKCYRLKHNGEAIYSEGLVHQNTHSWWFLRRLHDYKVVNLSCCLTLQSESPITHVITLYICVSLSLVSSMHVIIDDLCTSGYKGHQLLHICK